MGRSTSEILQLCQQSHTRFPYRSPNALLHVAYLWTWVIASVVYHLSGVVPVNRDGRGDFTATKRSLFSLRSLHLTC